MKEAVVNVREPPILSSGVQVTFKDGDPREHEKVAAI